MGSARFAITGTVGPNPRNMTLLGATPVIMNPVIRTLLPVPTASRVEIFASRIGGGLWADAATQKTARRTTTTALTLMFCLTGLREDRQGRNTRVIYAMEEISPVIFTRPKPRSQV